MDGWMNDGPASLINCVGFYITLSHLCIYIYICVCLRMRYSVHVFYFIILFVCFIFLPFDPILVMIWAIILEGVIMSLTHHTLVEGWRKERVWMCVWICFIPVPQLLLLTMQSFFEDLACLDFSLLRSEEKPKLGLAIQHHFNIHSLLLNFVYFCVLNI